VYTTTLRRNLVRVCRRYTHKILKRKKNKKGNKDKEIKETKHTIDTQWGKLYTIQ